MQIIAGDATICPFCPPCDRATLLIIKGKKQAIMARLETWYVLGEISTKPLLIVIVKEKRPQCLANLPRKAWQSDPNKL